MSLLHEVSVAILATSPVVHSSQSPENGFLDAKGDVTRKVSVHDAGVLVNADMSLNQVCCSSDSGAVLYRCTGR